MNNRQISRLIGPILSLPLGVNSLHQFQASYRFVSKRGKTKSKPQGGRKSSIKCPKITKNRPVISPPRAPTAVTEPPEIDISNQREFSDSPQSAQEPGSHNTESFAQRFPNFQGHEQAVNAKLQEMIAVDLAGETAAVRICQTHLFFYPKDDVVQEILHEEETHYDVMTQWANKLGVRTSLLDPVFHLASVAMASFTALLGPKAIMCCHAAIEEVITEHYNDQLREVVALEGAVSSEPNSEVIQGIEPPKNTTKEKLVEFRKTVKQFRDDEQHHHELGIDHGGKDFFGASILYNTVRYACKVGIFLAKRL